jgi:uncharacterized protein (DUF924 family)
MDKNTGVLQFWYGPWPFKQAAASTKSASWFQSSAENDQTIKDLFEAQIQAALIAPNPVEEMPIEEALATILLLDQFTRNIYRGTAQAFSGDALSLSICQSLVKTTKLERLPLPVSAFACMPLQHSEDAQVQCHAVNTFALLVDLHGEAARGFYDSAKQHKAIIDEFGRYPHRNKALNRINTTAEMAYLAGNAKTFGQ